MVFALSNNTGSSLLLSTHPTSPETDPIRLQSALSALKTVQDQYCQLRPQNSIAKQQLEDCNELKSFIHPTNDDNEEEDDLFAYLMSMPNTPCMTPRDSSASVKNTTHNNPGYISESDSTTSLMNTTVGKLPSVSSTRSGLLLAPSTSITIPPTNKLGVGVGGLNSTRKIAATRLSVQDNDFGDFGDFDEPLVPHMDETPVNPSLPTKVVGIIATATATAASSPAVQDAPPDSSSMTTHNDVNTTATTASTTETVTSTSSHTLPPTHPVQSPTSKQTSDKSNSNKSESSTETKTDNSQSKPSVPGNTLSLKRTVGGTSNVVDNFIMNPSLDLTDISPAMKAAIRARNQQVILYCNEILRSLNR